MSEILIEVFIEIKWAAERPSFPGNFLTSSPVHLHFLTKTTKNEEIHPKADFISTSCCL